MQAIAIITLCIAMAVAYGILHDQVTARVCVEYFTIGHPPMFGTESPTLLGLGWGIIATWWVGLSLGLGLAAAARIGSAPKLGLADLRRPIVTLMVVSAIAAFVAGLIGAALTATGIVWLTDEWAMVIPRSKHVAFLADAWAHGASYGVGLLGGLFLIGLTVRRRMRVKDRPAG